MEWLEERWNPANYDVTNLNDAGVGSFRAALTAANQNGDSVTFVGPNVNGAINLQTALNTITKDITISGPVGPGTTVQRGAGTFRILTIANSAHVTISKLTFAQGLTAAGDPNGGGIFTAGKLTLTDCKLDNNTAVGSGGGIYVSGALGDVTLNNTKVTNNRANANGGGIAFDLGKVTVKLTSEVSNNIALDRGGGIFLSGVGNVVGVKLTINDSIVTNNTATNDGGGIYAFWLGGVNENRVNLIKTNVSNNKAINGKGGGMYLGANTKGDALSTVSFNKSGDPKGDAIFIRGAAAGQVFNVEFKGTSQGNGYVPPPGGGGGMGGLSVNEAPEGGEEERFAIYVEDGAALTLEGTMIIGNAGHGVYGHVISLGNNYVEDSLTTSDGWIQSDIVT